MTKHKNITLEEAAQYLQEILGLVTFKRDENGVLHVLHVRGDVDFVGGDVDCVGGDVGDVGGYVWGNQGVAE